MLILMGSDKINRDLQVTPTSVQIRQAKEINDYWLKVSIMASLIHPQHRGFIKILIQ